ncbi:transcription termination/antitermination protein NusA [bacterium]|nr:transcription termination/antitermination protein NusA [bacterium]
MAEELTNMHFVDAFEDIITEKGLEKEVVLETLEEAIKIAIKNKYGYSENILVEIDPDLGLLEVSAEKEIVEKVENDALEISLEDATEINPKAKLGKTVKIKLDPSTFGRNAILAAKQRLIQKIYEAERERIYGDYQHKVGEVVTGSVQRFEGGSVVVNLGKAEGVIPKKEQLPNEFYQRGRTVRAYVKEVKKETKGPQIILSRTAPEFLKKLFEFEVPEIYEGRVALNVIARDPGKRSKIAVSSIDTKIDPVGACVGLKGVRVQSIVKELNNEKIDVIRFNPDPETFVSRALAPAVVIDCILYPQEKKITVVVSDDELSLAIGKGGQNARLAARLTGWKITIYGKSQYPQVLLDISEMEGVSPDLVEKLRKFEINTVQKLARVERKMFESIPELSDEEVDQLISEANKLVDKINDEHAFVTKT